jgi:hypothetical protein
VLQLAARVVRDVSRQVAGPAAFAGHLGEDDFAVLVTSEHAAALADAIIAGFDAQAPQLYDPEDADRGYIQLVNGDGMIRRVPIVTIAIGIADTAARSFFHGAEALTVAAGLARRPRAAAVRRGARSCAGADRFRPGRVLAGELVLELDRARDHVRDEVLRAPLGEVAVHAETLALPLDLAVELSRQQDDLGLRLGLLDPPGRLDAVHRASSVHHDHVGLERGGRDGLVPVAGRPTGDSAGARASPEGSRTVGSSSTIRPCRSPVLPLASVARLDEPRD